VSARSRRPGPLESLRDVRRELADLYRAARGGELPAQEASRLANVLDILRRAIADDEAAGLSERLGRLEAELAG